MAVKIYIENEGLYSALVFLIGEGIIERISYAELKQNPHRRVIRSRFDKESVDIVHDAIDIDEAGLVKLFKWLKLDMDNDTTTVALTILYLYKELPAKDISDDDKKEHNKLTRGSVYCLLSIFTDPYNRVNLSTIGWTIVYVMMTMPKDSLTKIETDLLKSIDDQEFDSPDVFEIFERVMI